MEIYTHFLSGKTELCMPRKLSAPMKRNLLREPLICIELSFSFDFFGKPHFISGKGKFPSSEESERRGKTIAKPTQLFF